MSIDIPITLAWGMGIFLFAVGAGLINELIIFLKQTPEFLKKMLAKDN